MIAADGRGWPAAGGLTTLINNYNNQKFLIDLNVELKEEIINFTNYELDSLDKTINYETFVNEVVAICKNNSFNLLETLDYNILNSF